MAEMMFISCLPHTQLKLSVYWFHSISTVEKEKKDRDTGHPPDF